MPIQFIRKTVVTPAFDILQERVVAPVIERATPSIQYIQEKGSQIVDRFKRDEPPPKQELQQIFTPTQIKTIENEQQKATNFIRDIKQGSTISYNVKMDNLLRISNIPHYVDRNKNEIVISRKPDTQEQKNFINTVNSETVKMLTSQLTEKEAQKFLEIEKKARPEITYEEAILEESLDHLSPKKQKELLQLVSGWEKVNNENLNFSVYHHRAVGTATGDEIITKSGLMRPVLMDENVLERARIETEIAKKQGKGNIFIRSLVSIPSYTIERLPEYKAMEEAIEIADLKGIERDSKEFEDLTISIREKKFWNLPLTVILNPAVVPSKIKEAWDLSKKDFKRGNENAEVQTKLLLESKSIGAYQDLNYKINKIFEKDPDLKNAEKVQEQVFKIEAQKDKLFDETGNIPEENHNAWNRLVEQQRPLIETLDRASSKYNYLMHDYDNVSNEYAEALKRVGIEYTLDEEGHVKITDNKFLKATAPYEDYLRQFRQIEISYGSLTPARVAGRIGTITVETMAFVTLLLATKGLGAVALGTKTATTLRSIGAGMTRATTAKGLARFTTAQGLKQTARFAVPKTLTAGFVGFTAYNEALREYSISGDMKSAIIMGAVGAGTVYGVLKAFTIPARIMRADEIEKWKQAVAQANKQTDQAIKQMYSGQPFITGVQYLGRTPPPQWMALRKAEVINITKSELIKKKTTEKIYAQLVDGKIKKVSFQELTKIPSDRIKNISITHGTSRLEGVDPITGKYGVLSHPTYKVVYSVNRFTGAKKFHIVPEFKKVLKQDFEIRFFLKDGRQIGFSAVGFFEKEIPKITTYEQFLRYTKGKKFFQFKLDQTTKEPIFLISDIKDIEMAGKWLSKGIPYSSKEVRQYFLKPHGYDPKTGGLKAEVRLAEKDWERIYKDINDAYKASSKFGKATSKVQYKPGDNIPRRDILRIFEGQQQSLIIDNKGNLLITNARYSAYNQMTGKIDYQYGLGISSKEPIITNLNKIQYNLQKLFDAFGHMPKSKLMKISNQETLNNIKKYYDTINKGKFFISQPAGDIKKLDPVVKRQVLSASEMKNAPRLDQIKVQDKIKYNELKDVFVAPPVDPKITLRAPALVDTLRLPTVADYSAGLLAKEKLLENTNKKLKLIQEELKPKQITTQQIQKLDTELRDVSQMITRTDYQSELRELQRQTGQTQILLQQEKSKLEQLKKTLPMQRDDYFKGMLLGTEKAVQQIQKQLQQQKQQLQRAMKLNTLFQQTVNFFNNLNTKLKIKPIKDLPYFNFPKIRIPPIRIKKIEEGQGYLALWLENKRWLAISPVMNRNGAIYEGFSATLRNVKVDRFRVRRVNYKRVAVVPGMEEPPHQQFKKVKYDKMGGIPIEEEWIQRK